MDIIRMGITGMGGIGNAHATSILANRNAALAAVCDIRPEALLAAQARFGLTPAQCFPSQEAMLASGLVDALVICTPNHVHCGLALDAIEKRMPFALEKPAGMNAKEVLAVKKAAEAAALPHMVCFSYRFKTAIRYVRHLVREGLIGDILHVHGHYMQSWAMDPALPRVWRFEKAMTGSGVLGDLGSHLLDLVRFIAGDFREVSARTDRIIKERKDPVSGEMRPVDVDDSCHMLASLTSGASAMLAVSRFAFGRGNSQRLELYGTKGTLVYELEDTERVLACVGQPYGDRHLFQEIPVPDMFRSDQTQSFLDVLHGKGDGLAATLSDGHANQAVMDAMLRSAETGCAEQVAVDVRIM